MTGGAAGRVPQSGFPGVDSTFPGSRVLAVAPTPAPRLPAGLAADTRPHGHLHRGVRQVCPVDRWWKVKALVEFAQVWVGHSDAAVVRGTAQLGLQRTAENYFLHHVPPSVQVVCIL